MLNPTWRQYAQSYDPRIIVNEAHPRTVLPVVLGAIGIILAMHFIPQARKYADLDNPWLPIGLLVVAGSISITQWRIWHRKNVINVLMLIDACLYCLAVVAVMLDTTSPIRYVWALLYAQMAAHYGILYAFGWPMLFSVGVVPFAVSLYFGFPDFGLIALALFGAVMFIVNSTSTAKAREVQRQKERFQSAYLLTDRVATESLDIALATSMAETGNFLHEMRNTLTPLTPNLRILQQELDLDEEQKEMLQSAIATGDRCNELVEKLLKTIKRRAAVTDSTFSLPDVIDSVVAKSRFRGKDEDLEVQGRIPDFTISGNPEHLQSVIENLVQNAHKSGASRVTISGSYDGGLQRALLEIEDDGPGIPTSRHESLFTPSLSDGSGHGLGLPLSRRLVELLGGELNLARTGSDGTTFLIRLSGRHAPTSLPPQEPS